MSAARMAKGMSEGELGRAVSLGLDDIVQLESGERRLVVSEVLAIAEALDIPLDSLVDEPVAAVVSRRRDPSVSGESSGAVDAALHQFASEVRELVEAGILGAPERNRGMSVPRDHADAERLSQDLRRDLELGSGPVADLGETCERLGLFVSSPSLGEASDDGGCVEVAAGAAAVGAAVVNGDAAAGRRRMTLAHELGHWLCGDAYDAHGSTDEKMINSFAVHFLAPRSGVHKLWTGLQDLTPRDRALATGAQFRLSWSATVGHLKNLGLVDAQLHAALAEDRPRRGDYVRLRLSWVDELEPPYLSPLFAAACIEGYVSRRLTATRTLELLHGTLSFDDLPQPAVLTFDDFRASFAGHDA